MKKIYMILTSILLICFYTIISFADAVNPGLVIISFFFIALIIFVTLAVIVSIIIIKKIRKKNNS